MRPVRCILLLTLSVSAAFAQVQTGRIVGTVFDPNHASVANAQVTVTQIATNERTAVATNAEGEYTATPLNPGLYTVRVTMPGFETTVVTNLEVLVGQSSRADVTLRIGETTIVLDIDGLGAPLLDTECAGGFRLIVDIAVLSEVVGSRDRAVNLRVALVPLVTAPVLVHQAIRIAIGGPGAQGEFAVGSALSNFHLDVLPKVEHVAGHPFPVALQVLAGLFR